MHWRFLVPKIIATLLVFGVASGLTTMVAAQDLTISAKVDKTTVGVGDPINLTIALSGDLNGVEMTPPQFPKKFVVVGRSQSTNMAFRGGVMERSTSLKYALVPQEGGTFQLGPFQLQRQKSIFKTEPITITVKKSVLPPNLPSSRERFTL